MRSSTLIILTAVLLGGAGADDTPRQTVGHLMCTPKSPTPDSPENMACAFSASFGTASDHQYVSSFWTLGKQVLVWSVTAPPKTKPASGFLAQRYERQRLRGHRPSWVGKVNSSIALQFDTHASAELGSGIQAIVLKIATTSA